MTILKADVSKRNCERQHRQGWINRAANASRGWSRTLNIAINVFAWSAATHASAQNAVSSVISEVRAGVYLHQDSRFQRTLAQSDDVWDGSPVDLNIEVQFADPGLNVPPMLDTLLNPHPFVGATVNTGGGASSFHFGVTWHQDLLDELLFAEASLGAAVQSGYTGDSYDEMIESGFGRRLGCNSLAFSGVTGGVKIGDHLTAMLTVEHLGNFQLCDFDDQLTNIGFRLGYRFGN